MISPLLAARGLAAPPRAPLRAADLVPGRLYFSPSGRKCMLLAPSGYGIGCNNFLFAYVTRSGRASEDDGFAINAANARAIASLQEVGQ